MGGTTFETDAQGETVQEAFRAAREQALYDYGHAGYTGTIAEKDGWTVISQTPLPAEDAQALADKLLQEDDPRISDKWGPAGAIPIDGGGWLFFGWASC